MLRTLKDLFNAVLPPQAGPAAVPDEHALQLATAVLLVEVMRSDVEMHETERQSVLQALRRKFELQDDELQRLLELATTTAHRATDFHAFTNALNS